MIKALLTVWLRPGNTIEAILAKPTPIAILLVLGALTGIVSALFQVAVAGVIRFGEAEFWILLAAPVGIVALYLGSFGIWCIGRLLGGRATRQAVRAAVAWGSVPTITALAPLLTLFFAAPAQKLLLAPATLLILWSWGTTIAMLRRIQGFGLRRAIMVYLIGGLLLTLTLAACFRAFFYEPFRVESNSMEPTLSKGDSVFVAKYAYGFSRYSLPNNLKLISGRIFANDPRRGDLVVLKLPSDPRQTYLKRIIGLPGDHIQISQRVLSINGQTAALEERGVTASRFLRFRETLPDGRSYDVQEAGGAAGAPPENTEEFVVPDGQCFVLGDNRDNSLDKPLWTDRLHPAGKCIWPSRARFLFRWQR